MNQQALHSGRCVRIFFGETRSAIKRSGDGTLEGCVSTAGGNEDLYINVGN